eukprot:1606058-Rhodomonas_salina.2
MAQSLCKRMRGGGGGGGGGGLEKRVVDMVERFAERGLEGTSRYKSAIIRLRARYAMSGFDIAHAM